MAFIDTSASAQTNRCGRNLRRAYEVKKYRFSIAFCIIGLLLAVRHLVAGVLLFGFLILGEIDNLQVPPFNAGAFQQGNGVIRNQTALVSVPFVGPLGSRNSTTSATTFVISGRFHDSRHHALGAAWQEKVIG